MNNSNSSIKKITAFECLDSRGFPSISCTVALTDGTSGTALVPSGASTGEHEAHELRDKENRFLGKGVLKAIKNIETSIQDEIAGEDVLNLAAIDKKLINLDGTENKSNLGANAILAVSLASAHAGANFQKKPLYQYLGSEDSNLLPIPLVNVINGGAHASNSLDFQEFMLVPHGKETFSENIRAACEVFHTLKKNLLKMNLSVGVGDEGGFAPNIESAEQALNILIDTISDAGYEPGKDISLALDVAASEFYEKETGKYFLKKSSQEKLSSDELISLYDSWVSKFPLVSIEDGLDENDWDGWQNITKKIGDKVQLVGDDLFVTNPKRLQTGIDKSAANSILIKLNQIGTVSETLDAIKLAKENNFSAVISHRSGETEDTSIADLVVATGTGQIKTGSVCRSERTAKYNRLLWIEKNLGSNAKSAKPF
ncbi:UNVERIFIED_CONTAM: hypothetical protein GTU68_028112 [Idotea baltica]|nr:hypothetical protein [Idotea baltica]